VTVDISALRSLLEKSRPRPWSVGDGWEQMDPGVYVADAHGGIVVEPGEIEAMDQADASLSVAAVNALPDLLYAYEERERLAVEARTLRAERDRLNRRFQDLFAMAGCEDVAADYQVEKVVKAIYETVGRANERFKDLQDMNAEVHRLRAELESTKKKKT